MPRTTRCDAAVQGGRLAKAEQFARVAADVADLADVASDVADAYTTLAVHAGIAAADVICCARLGEHARGEGHQEAIGLLEKADRGVAKHLATLLRVKTAAGYGHKPVSRDDVARVGRAMDAVVAEARLVAST